MHSTPSLTLGPYRCCEIRGQLSANPAEKHIAIAELPGATIEGGPPLRSALEKVKSHAWIPLLMTVRQCISEINNRIRQVRIKENVI